MKKVARCDIGVRGGGGGGGVQKMSFCTNIFFE